MSTLHPSDWPGSASSPITLLARRERHPTARVPTPLTPLVGRQREIAVVRELLRQPEVRLVTLTGPGGIGKTRLAVHVAAELADSFADGAAFVDLAAISDPDLVLPTVAQALGLREAANLSPGAQLASYLGEQRLLLVLDNLEHVAEVAPRLATLLAACRGLKLLTTSRLVLRLSGEHAFPGPPLTLPDRVDGSRRWPPLAELAKTEAVALFVQRARAADPSFGLTEANAPTVADVCARLDGLPLAIELAAVRTRLLSPEALLARLSDRLRLLTGGARDAPERLRAMRDAIAWSHDLLSPAERTLFRRLAVFAGGFTLDAAEGVVGAAGELGLDVLDGIGVLIDQSLLRRKESADSGGYPEPRFAMLETVREYGLERLAASGEAAATRDAHAAFCLALAEPPDPTRSAGAQDEHWLRRLDAEHDNFRAALAWLAGVDAGERLLRLATALTWFWYRHGHLREGAEWLDRALAACPPGSEDAAPALWLRALGEAGTLAWELGDYPRAVDWLEAGLALARADGDRAESGRALLNLGVAAEKQGNDDRAAAHYAEALALFREAGDRAGAAIALINLGDTAYRQGDDARSAALSDEALTLSRELGDRLYTALALGNLGQLALERGDTAEARARFAEALALSSQMGDGWGIADALAGLAGAAALAGQPARAARWLGAAQAHCDAIGTPSVPHHRQFARAMAAAQTRLSVPAFSAAWATGHALSLEQAAAEATDPAYWGELGGEQEKPSQEATAAARSTSTAGLTERELAVLRLLVAGRTDREIAEVLFISRRTAQGHVAGIFAKLGVRTRTAAATAALAAGIVAADHPSQA